MKIGFLGTGHITFSIIEGIFKSKLKIKKIYISPRNRLIATRLRRKYKRIIIAKNNQELVNKSKWVFLAVTPSVGKKILKKINFSNKKIISFISTINLENLKKLTKRKEITRVIPLPFIGMRVGPIVIFPTDSSVKNFWATSSFMAPYYNLLSSTSDWLVKKGVKRKQAENYVRELFLALSKDAKKKNKLSLKQLVVESQTPGGTNAYVLKELKKKKFYKVQQKVLNSILKKF